MIVMGCFSLEIIVHNIKDTTNPMRVAWVNQLICSTVEATKLGLPLR